MRRSPAEVHFCRRRTAETLMRAEVRVVDEADLDFGAWDFRAVAGLGDGLVGWDLDERLCPRPCHDAARTRGSLK